MQEAFAQMQALAIERAMVSARALRGWHQMLINQGFFATLRTATMRLRDRGQRQHGDARAANGASQPPAVHPFDLQYGVETSGLIWGEHLRSGERNDRWNTAYYGIAPSVFHASITRLPIDFREFAFIDFGSGKGRAVMLATHYPFAEIYGVELAPELHTIAEANLRIFLGARNIQSQVRLVCTDAVKFALPERPLVLFFYHPFCRPVLKRVLRNLEVSLRARPRPAYVVYINPELRELLDRAPFLERLSEGTLAMDAEDELADRIGSSVEECAIYRSVQS
jgi:hypothetical protein